MADNRTENRSLRAEIKAEHAALRDEIERLKVSSDTAEHVQQQQFPMLEEFSRLAREQQETQEKLAASEALLAAQQEKLSMVDSYTWAQAQDRESVPTASLHSFEQAAFRQQRHEQLCRLQQMSDEGGASNELAPEVICA